MPWKELPCPSSTARCLPMYGQNTPSCMTSPRAAKTFTCIGRFHREWRGWAFTRHHPNARNVWGTWGSWARRERNQTVTPGGTFVHAHAMMSWTRCFWVGPRKDREAFHDPLPSPAWFILWLDTNEGQGNKIAGTSEEVLKEEEHVILNLSSEKQLSKPLLISPLTEEPKEDPIRNQNLRLVRFTMDSPPSFPISLLAMVVRLRPKLHSAPSQNGPWARQGYKSMILL